jgi:hypothetical protein
LVFDCRRNYFFSWNDFPWIRRWESLYEEYKQQCHPGVNKISKFNVVHIFTIFLFVSAIPLAYIAYDPQFARAAYPVICVNFLGALLFFYLGLGQHRVLLKMPGAYLMGGTALLAWLGIS